MDTLNETDLLSFETQDGTKVELAKEDLLIDMAQDRAMYLRVTISLPLFWILT